MTTDGLVAAIAEAARPFAIQWPLAELVPTSPLAGLVDLDVGCAFEVAGRLLGAELAPSADLLEGFGPLGEVRAARAQCAEPDRWGERGGTALERLDAEAGTRRAAKADAEVATWLGAVASGAVDGPARARFWETRVRGTPPAGFDDPDPLHALGQGLQALGVGPAGWVAELAGQFARLPGWTAHANWASTMARDGELVVVDRAELAALKVCLDALLAGGRYPKGAPRRTRGRPEVDLGPLEAAETRYERDLASRLAGPPLSLGEPPIALVATCIDVRAEPLRRHLERLGPVRTEGVAGFFGLPATIIAPASRPRAYLPGILSPTLALSEVPEDPAELALHEGMAGLARALRSARKGAARPYALAEVAGIPLGAWALARQFAGLSGPSSPPRGVPVVEGPGAPDDDAQAAIVRANLEAFGCSPLPELVVLLGHRASAPNNAQAGALSCGACGAAPGGRNARWVALMANRPEVRARLVDWGWTVPEGTWFLAGEHDTTTDEVELFDLDLVPEERRGALTRTAELLARAGEAVRAERARRLGVRPRELVRRSRAWSEVQPELGLAGAAAMLIGPRAASRGVDLAGRVFLHSYDPGHDADGVLLASILEGPALVAHHIVMGYFAAATDPRRYSSGDKAAHEVVGLVGVRLGGSLDLGVGFAVQAVAVEGRLVHEPLRLLVVVDAARTLVERALERAHGFAALLRGRWVRVAVRDVERGLEALDWS